MMPILETLSQEYADRLNIVSIDADEDDSTAKMEEYDVRSIPTLVLLDESGRVLDARVGQQSLISMKEWIDGFTGSPEQS